MNPGKVFDHQNWREKIPKNSWNFYFILNAPIRKNPPKFENDIKWPTFLQQLKAKTMNKKGGGKLSKSLVLIGLSRGWGTPCLSYIGAFKLPLLHVEGER